MMCIYKILSVTVFETFLNELEKDNSPICDTHGPVKLNANGLFEIF